MEKTYHINDIDLIEVAFEVSIGSINYYFDRETGEIISIHDDMTDDEMFEEVMQYADETEKEEDLREDPYTVFSSDRFVGIDPPFSYEGYNLMVEFAEELENQDLFQLLQVALIGKGAFRRFKDVLYEFPEEQDRWFRYKRVNTLTRILEWNQLNNVVIIGIEELINEINEHT